MNEPVTATESMQNQQNGQTAGVEADFHKAIKHMVLQLLDSVPDLSPSDKTFLWSLSSRPERFGFSKEIKLMEIAARASCRAVATLPAEMWRGQILARMAAPSLHIVDTWLDEGRKQRAADTEHDSFIVERQSVRRDAALDRLLPHYDALRLAIDSLHQWTPNGRRFA